ncbi:hypothetical protein Tco_1345876 [Tanacetum coccineum]
MTTNVLFQAVGVEVYDSDYDDIPNAQPSFMANTSCYGFDVLAEVNNQDNMNNNMINQAMQAMPSSKQSSVVNHSETEITSDRNIIPYSDQVINCTKINLDNKSVDDTLAAELERYKEQSVESNRLKQTLSKHLKEKECLMQTVTLLKNDFKKEESRNIDREIDLEKRIKQLNNIVFKRDQSAQTVHMLMKPQFFYDHTTKQALESRSKMLLKQQDPMMLENKVNTTPVDYAVLNQLSQDFEKLFVPQYKLSAEQVFWSQNSINSSDPHSSCRPTKVEVPKELPKVSMVNTSLKKLKHHLAGFDVVMEQHRLESKTFEVKMNKVLNENERHLEQVINKDIVNIIMNSTVDNDYVNVHECEKCLKLETELLNKKDFIEKETYDKLFRSFITLEKHCISLEVDTQVKQEIFQRDNSVSNQSAASFDQYFELNELKAQS